jgi:hypothetical protein
MTGRDSVGRTRQLTAFRFSWAGGAALLPVLVAVLTATPAFAATTGSDDGNGTVTVGVADGVSAPGAPGSTSADGSGSDGAGQSSCTSTSLLLNDEGGFAPGGPTPGGWYSVTCINSTSGASTTQTVWISSQTTIAAPAIDPRTVALQAERSLTLPVPTLHFNPAAFSLVNLPTWLWIDSSVWHPYSVTASVGAVSATAVAEPTAVVWSTGDGGALTCDGPGQAFVISRPARGQQTACQHTYRSSSLGQPSGTGNPDTAAYPVRAAIDWSVSWSAAGSEGQGTLPSLTTTAVTSVRVVQVESVGAATPGLPDAGVDAGGATP